MNLLAIDYGKKRIGLAWCQTGLDVVLPYGVASNLDEVVDLIKKETIDKLIIGMPIGLDGKKNENTKKVHKFAADLRERIDLPIEFIDERFSSRQADSMGGDVSRDEKAAMVILQSYIDKNN